LLYISENGFGILDFVYEKLPPPQSPLIRGEVFDSPPVFLSPFGGNTKGAGELEGVKLFISKILKKCNTPKPLSDVYIKHFGKLPQTNRSLTNFLAYMYVI
jgi:hypothetical protein